MGWWLLVVYVLDDHTFRIGDFARTIDGISRRTLTVVLKGLQRDGIVERIVVPTSPPQVQYRLTERGRSLRTRVAALGEWANENLPGWTRPGDSRSTKPAADPLGE
jgi:DNA-binding HxlR family transcriptional regulator